jgi:hypothetical protein
VWGVVKTMWLGLRGCVVRRLVEGCYLCFGWYLHSRQSGCMCYRVKSMYTRGGKFMWGKLSRVEKVVACRCRDFCFCTIVMWEELCWNCIQTWRLYVMLQFYSLIRSTYYAGKTTYTSREYTYEELVLKREVSYIARVTPLLQSYSISRVLPR